MENTGAWMTRMLCQVSPRTAVSIKGKFKIVQKMDYPRRDIYLDIESGYEFFTRLHSCKKEPETVHWIETFIGGREVFYDIGANVGVYSLIAAKSMGGDGKIFSFEPGFSSFSQLCKNIYLNQCSDSITPLQIALSNKTRLEAFNYSSLEGIEPGGALHSLGECVDENGKPFIPFWHQKLMGFRLDDLIQEFLLPIPNYIKLDVDGHELEILEGGKETLSNPEVKSLLVEINEGLSKGQRLVQFLEGAGFGIKSRHLIRESMSNIIFTRM
ncbi:MAG: FkbM family methyltransferase [Chlamydiae bacterium]|nr:FkbM family methyltransferase [Chlamydiota bacterium]MBI3276233.1 FkbM family methyltransferase [Chlamydiota bacterium]